MYIKEIQIHNNGPIEKLHIEPQFTTDGKPLPLLLIGKNGSGKTLLLSSILDSFVEFKKKVYSNMPEVDSSKLLKLGSTTYISPSQNYLYSNIKFIGNNDHELTYTDFATKSNPERFVELHSGLALDGINLANHSEYADGFYRKITHANDRTTIKDNLRSNILAYFPHSRYDHPEWLHEDVKIGFKIKNNYIGHTDNSIIKDYVVPQIITWLLDCLLDEYLYEKPTTQRSVKSNGKTEIWTVLTTVNGKNTIIHQLLNQLLKSIYRLKFLKIEYARIGITQKQYRKIAIYIKEIGKDEVEITPTFSHLSSGEVMILSLFASIIQDYDKLNIDFTSLSEIKGIVVVDEIDLHLHIEQQKILLPELISMFPKVQFIISTHSPFFLLGMKDRFGEKLQLVNMPLGNEVKIDDFCEIQDAYDIFISGFDGFKKTHEQLKDRFNTLTKPLVITEGKTDWKHIKVALAKLQAQGKFTDIPEFDFLEYGDELEMGSSHLKTHCLQRAKITNGRNEKKIIYIFDRDESNFVKDMNPPADSTSLYKTHTNNVYSFCIPIPSHRPTHKLVTIEHYYSDDELITKDEHKRRIFLTSEFTEKGSHKVAPNLRHGNYNKVRRRKSQTLESTCWSQKSRNIHVYQ